MKTKKIKQGIKFGFLKRKGKEVVTRAFPQIVIREDKK